MIERTLVFVKPQNEDIAFQVFDYLEKLLNSTSVHRERITKVKNVPENVITEHYRDLKIFNEEIFKNTIEAYKNGTIFITAYQDESIIPWIRRYIGPTAPEKIDNWTVRGHFRKDTLEAALSEKRYFNNIIHASSTQDEAKREIELWKDYLTN
jgi:nucleoside diphosphate kinase